MIIKSDKIKNKLTNDLVNKYKDQKKKLVVVNQNDDIATAKFVKAKKNLAEKLKVQFEEVNFVKNDSKENVISVLKDLNTNPNVDGIIVQLPIKNEKEILKHISIEKDVDCLHPFNLGLFFRAQSQFIPPVVFAVDQMLTSLGIKLKGKNVLLVGSGILTGQPLTGYFMDKKAEVFVVNKYVKDLKTLSTQADIIISATGVCNLISTDHVKSGQLLIDLGGGSVNGKLVGDINTEAVKDTADIIPTPGGVGPLTVLGLFYNLLNTK